MDSVSRSKYYVSEEGWDEVRKRGLYGTTGPCQLIRWKSDGESSTGLVP